MTPTPGRGSTSRSSTATTSGVRTTRSRALRLYKELGGQEPSALQWLKELEAD